VTNVEDYKKLREYEKEKFTEMIKAVCKTQESLRLNSIFF